MSVPESDVRVRMAGLILLLLMAAAAAPVLDDIIGFLAEAPYVEYLQALPVRGADTAALAGSHPAAAAWTFACEAARDILPALPAVIRSALGRGLCAASLLPPLALPAWPPRLPWTPWRR